MHITKVAFCISIIIVFPALAWSKVANTATASARILSAATVDWSLPPSGGIARESNSDREILTTTGKTLVRLDAQGKVVSGPPNAIVTSVNFQ